MSEIISTIYADLYDLIYDDKDYIAECDLIERFPDFERDPDETTLNVLEVARAI